MYRRLYKTLKMCIASLCLLMLPEIASANVHVSKWTVPDETLTYNIMYKWGLINKKAGEVAIRTAPGGGDLFDAHLTGKTAEWADSFFEVRDTLKGKIDRKTFLPTYYEKISNEGGSFEHSVLHYTRSGNTTTANVKMHKKGKKDKTVSFEEKVLTADDGMTIDMLSAFYYMRKLEYSAMKKGETVKVNVFSGKKKELLTIHYVGPETIKVDNKKHSCYHITFTFTSKNGKKTSDNMDAWISITPGKIPLLMEGKLPVGKVRAVYSGTIH